MTDQHTPGPWPAPEEDCGSGGSWYDIDGICRFVSKEADALLIATAPDLLAAATSARAMFLAIASVPIEVGFHVSVFAATVKQLDAAIAKATRSAA